MAAEPTTGAGTSAQGFYLAVALAALAVALVIFLPVYLTTRARAALEHQAVDLVTVSAVMLGSGVSTDDGAEVERLVDALAAIPEVSYVVVRRGTGEAVAERNGDQMINLVTGDGTGAVYEGDLLHVTAPIPGVAPLTTVQLGYETAAYRQQRLINVLLPGMLAALLIFGAVLVALGAQPQIIRVVKKVPVEVPVAQGVADVGHAATQAILSEDTFLAFLSHELRTPLNAIIGYAEMLQEDAIYLEQNDLLPDLKKIMKAGSHLITLVDDVVDLSRVYANTIELDVESFAVAVLVEDVQEDVRSLLNRTLASVEVKISPQVHRMKADREKLRRALGTVIRQSATLSGQGRIFLTVKRDNAPDRAWVIFKLKNTELVLNAEQIDGLLHDFTQDKAKSLTQYSGSGLGLVVAREFCRLQGGSMEVESSKADGTTLTMRLPEVVTVEGSASDSSV